MKLSSNSIVDGQPIPGDYAFCVPDPDNHVALAANRNPHHFKRNRYWIK